MVGVYLSDIASVASVRGTEPFSSPFVFYGRRTESAVDPTRELVFGARGDAASRVSTRHFSGRYAAGATVCAGLRFLPNNFFSTRIPLSTCLSSSRKGGRKRRTVSCVT